LSDPPLEGQGERGVERKLLRDKIKKKKLFREKKREKNWEKSIKRKRAQKRREKIYKKTREEEKNIEAPFLPYTINDVADHNNNEQLNWS